MNEADLDLSCKVAEILGWTKIERHSGKSLENLLEPMWGNPPRWIQQHGEGPEFKIPEPEYEVRPVPLYPWWWGSMKDLVEWLMDQWEVAGVELLHGRAPKDGTLYWICRLMRHGAEIHTEQEDRPALALCKAVLWLHARRLASKAVSS